jgi:hypothetical protein
MRKPVLAAISGLLLYSCASDPIIDPKGVNMAQYEKDKADCEQVAQQVNTAAKVGKSGAAGAAVGAAVGAIYGDAGKGAAAGGVQGGAAGGLSADQEKARVVRNCLRNRGYTVLN